MTITPGKWNGLGGKCEPDESPLEAAIREFKEESGLVLEPGAVKPLGVLQFPNFKPAKHEDWMVFVFFRGDSGWRPRQRGFGRRKPPLGSAG